MQDHMKDQSSTLFEEGSTRNGEEFNVAESDRLFVMHTILRDDALRDVTDNILSVTSSVDEAFDKLHSHFMMPAHRDTYMTEWFTFLKSKGPKKST